MTFRITPDHIRQNAVRYSQGHLRNLAHLQEQLATGLRIIRPSDDPGNISPLLSNKSTVNRIEIDLQNIASARAKLNQSNAQLTSALENLTRAANKGLEGVQSQEIERTALADEVNSILESLLAIANVSEGGRALYGGTSGNLTPFEITQRNGDGHIAAVEYTGSQERSRIVVGVRATVDVLYAGDEVFGSDDRSETFYVGQTGARAGTGTDSGTGMATLEVRHTLTTFSGASGLQPGTNTAQDTVLGAHTITVDATQNTLQLDGGTKHTFVPGDTNFLLKSDNGLQVFVDTSSLAGGFVGTINIQGDGTLSTDQGVTQTAIDFSSNQVVIDSITGAATNVDSSQIRMAGIEHLEYTGTQNVFQALIELRDDLLNRRSLSTQDWVDAIGRRIVEVQRMHEHISLIEGEQGVAALNLNALEQRTEDLQLETQQAISEIESADMAEVSVQLQTEQTALQFTYAATVRLLETSLLDFLR